MGDGKGRDRLAPRGAIARRTSLPPSVLGSDVEKRENRELAAGRRTVSVKGSGGVTATVVVTVRRGTVWLSMQPPFTWEAIMEPDKVGELMQTLAQAQEEARKAAERYRL
ncbi:MAG: hypothetical protein ACRDQI_07880 [Pseudonocardiaceae bacterium]